MEVGVAAAVEPTNGVWVVLVVMTASVNYRYPVCRDRKKKQRTAADWKKLPVKWTWTTAG